MFLFGPYWILLIPGLLFTLWAQWKVRSTFERYSKVPAASGMTGAQVARELLAEVDTAVTEVANAPQAAQALRAVQVEATPGVLTDHYDPSARVLRLSEPIYSGSSLAALGVAAHETGHAFQHATNYGPMGLRSALVPMASIGSNLAFPLFVAGMFLGGMNQQGGFGLLLMNAGILLFSLAVVFTVLTLPVEFNASRRAIRLLQDGNYLRPDEVAPTKAVLDAAALTYVAAAATAILSLVRLILIRNSRED